MVPLLWTQLTTCIMLMVCSSVECYYISANYYMDPTQSDAFGGVCDDSIGDDSMFISSHMNPFNLVNYGSNKRCRLLIDAGPIPGARYRLRLMRWQIERPSENGTCSDYLSIYDGNVGSLPSSNATLRGVYCGAVPPNITDVASQRFLTFSWTTNGHLAANGFRILAIRTETPPCSDEQFLCKAENRCILSDLICDGLPHCDDLSDERSCSGVQKFIRVFVRLGLSGLVAVGVTVVGVLVLLIIVVCCVKCIKQNKVSHAVTIRPNRFNAGNGSCHSNVVALGGRPNRGTSKSSTRTK